MARSEPSYHLWIATDDSRTVVALAPLRVSGSPLRHEWGSITNLRALPPSKSSPNLPAAVLLVAVVALGVVGLCFGGAPVAVTLILAALALLVGSVVTLSKPPPSQVEEPPDRKRFPELYRTLESTGDREDFLDLVGLAERAGRALPDVAGVIDPGEGGELLAQVLWESAVVLDRRQQLRPQVLHRSSDRTAAADSSASRVAQSLIEQRERIKASWDKIEAELSRIRTALELAAVAAENAAHDPGASGAVREAYRELADVYGGGTN